MRMRLPVVLSLGLVLAAAPVLMAQGGHFEFSGHYGRWSLNILGNKAVELLDDVTGDELGNAIEEKIRETHPNLYSTQYEQVTDFSSSGSNFGASFRWYPAGRRGSFSLGLSVEKCDFKVLPTGTSTMELEDAVTSVPAAYAGTASGSARIKATAFLLTFRWDILPTKAFHPYLTFGGGISTARSLDDSSVAYEFDGQLTSGSFPTEAIAGSESWTLRELRDEAMEEEESDFPIPNFLPFIQLNIGLKLRLTKSLSLFVDGGVLDGFLARGGLALRL